MTYRYNSKGKADEQYIPATIEQPKCKAQLYMPDVVYTQVFVDAFKHTPYIEWLTPSVEDKKVVSGQFQYYKMCVDTTDKGKDGQSTLVKVFHMGKVDQNKHQIVAKPTTPVITGTPTTTTTSTTDSKLDILIALMTKQLEGKK